MPGRTGRARSRRWPRLSAIPGLPSGQCARAWTGLAAEDAIRPCDPEIVAARIKRADRRPKGWDLDLSQVRDDLTGTDLTALEHQFPGPAARVAAAACPEADGVQSPHPAGTVDIRADGVQSSHLADGAGCNERTDGVQPALPRGAAVAPEPSLEPSSEPSAAPTRGREALPAGMAMSVANRPGSSSTRLALRGG